MANIQIIQGDFEKKLKLHYSHEPVQENDGNHERVFPLRLPCVEESKSETGGVIKLHLITNS